MITLSKRVLLLVLLSVCFFHTANAQWFKKKDKKKQEEATPPQVVVVEKSKSDIKELEYYTRKFKKKEGLFTLYQDTTTGTTYMVIKKEQIDKEFIYFCHTVDGISAAGHYRGNFRDNKIISIRKYFNKIDIVHENTNFYFDNQNPLSKAAGANISPAVLESQYILAESRNKDAYLIRADEVFLSESLHQVKSSGSGFSLGSLSKDKTKYITQNNYPLNTDVVVEYVYVNPSPLKKGGNDVTDARSVSIKLQHSFIEMPENSFKPRFDDPRVGFFTTQTDDMTSKDATPYRDFIHKWDLEKKDKDADISEPVEPIVFWIENTTPHQLRPIIRAAGLAWNIAFERAGFKNAIEIKEQPDTASWEAGDIRYNVLRWTSSPNPPFGGYGPSFVNPRTGQILGADIMLEYIFMTNRLKQEKLFNAAGLAHMSEAAQSEEADNYCSMGMHLQHSTLFGAEVLKARDLPEDALNEYSQSSLFYLILHEMGHTLGLNHNMKASQLHSPEQINIREITEQVGLTGSVMDYPAVNLSAEKGKQGQFFTTRPGPYDVWAIEFAYSAPVPDEEVESARLEKILSRSTEPELAFGNDADDMRYPGKGIDPRVMIGDMSSDAIAYSVDRIKLSQQLTHQLKDRYTSNGKTYHELRNAYLILTGEMNTSAAVISRYIGGVYVDRAMVGQENASSPFTAVGYEDQKRAMKALAENVFSPESLKAPDELYKYLQMQRRGFNFYGTTEDPKISARILNIHRGVLNHLLHPVVMKRVTDSEHYGNRYKLSEMLADLTNAIFVGDLKSPVSIFRRNLQTEYVNELLEASGLEGKGKHDYASQAMAFYQLQQIRKMMQTHPAKDIDTKAHRDFLEYKIAKAMEQK
jgi:hypothetical protein